MVSDLLYLFQEFETESMLSLEWVDVVQLRQLHINDPDVQSLWRLAVEILEEEKGTCLFKKYEVLWRRWRPPHVSADEGMWDCHQIVMPEV